MIAIMTTPNELDVLRAAVNICDETGGGATHDAIAARLGVDEEVVLLKLLPAVAKYFGKTMGVTTVIAVVREPTAEARRFVGL